MSGWEVHKYLAHSLAETFPSAVDRFTGYYEAHDVSVVFSVLAGLGAPERVFTMGQDVQAGKAESAQRRVSFQPAAPITTAQVIKNASDKSNPFLREKTKGDNKSGKSNPFLRG